MSRPDRQTGAFCVGVCRAAQCDRRTHSDAARTCRADSIYTARPVWHYAITQAQTQQLESVQKRAIHIIWYSTRGLSYRNALLAVNSPSLQARLEELSNSFFHEICNPNSCLNYLLHPKRDTSVTSRLRAATPYPVQHYAPKSTVHL